MTLKKQMDKIYGEYTANEIPWNMEDPPDLLMDLVKSGWILPCDGVDLGCGLGNYALWFASRGFTMTGLDLSTKAVELANIQARKENIACRFLDLNMTGRVKGFEKSFDFAYDWEVLHHIFPEYRESYVRNVHSMLRPGGRYFSLCFSDQEPSRFEGSGKYRKTPLGTTLYFSSENELRELFEPLFVVEEIGTVEIAGKKGSHLAVKALLSKKDI